MKSNSTTNDPYEDIDFPSVAFKPTDDEVGASITISLSDVRTVETERDGKTKTGIVLEGKDDRGVLRDWVAWNRANQAIVQEARAQLGSRVKIVYVGRDKGAKDPAFAARLFTVEVV